ncbi:hypothetical protein J4730_22275 [Klebsiella pneumoniae]|uniref:Uncharacterized protein n=1 Tax=Klebsiella pneumoniae TaxID=573 RepID=A0A939NIZ1_KLEPN|nr:hypothetical protein [Klebsiella pneumoniae]
MPAPDRADLTADTARPAIAGGALRWSLIGAVKGHRQPRRSSAGRAGRWRSRRR